MAKKLTIKGKPPLDYLLEVINDDEADPKLRVKAAGIAAQYLHTRTKDGGKKDAAQGAADVAASGKFAPAAAPKLKVVR